MRQLARICAATLFAILPACSAQTAYGRHKPDPEPGPAVQTVFEFIRGALLSLSPDDGINDNIDVKFDVVTKVLTVTQPDGHCDQFMNSLEANDVVWDVFDPSSQYQQREKLLRVTLVSVSGKAARTCYDKKNRVDNTILTNRARFLFSLSKAQEMPDFQSKMTKAFKKLIELSGGEPEQKLF
jgi:hypothetical protein